MCSGDATTAAATSTELSADIKRAMSIDSILDHNMPPAIRRNVESSPPGDAASDSSAPVDAADAPTPSTEIGASPDEDFAMEGVVNGSDKPAGAARTDGIVPEFTCRWNDYSPCMTGQYTLKLARKVISNHFGRNKACTRQIQSWPLFCRKHYQRCTYQPDSWQRRKIELIIHQLHAIEKATPGTTYTVSLKKSEMDRLNTFARATDSGMKEKDAAVLVAPNTAVKSYQTPIMILRELQFDLGTGKSMEMVRQLVVNIFDMFKKHEVTEVPAIEFLPEFPPTKPVKVKTVKAPAAKKTKSTGRVSGKGAIKKPGAK